MAAFCPHTLRCFDAVLQPSFWSLAKLLISLVVVWHLYVPIHELMHAAGCMVSGGTVRKLDLQPRYGARVLQPIFPFVTVDDGSTYAGRLSGFSTPNAWSYAVVDLMPYLPSLLGLTVLELARRRRSTFVFVAGFVLAYAPWISITGDFYELASLVTTPVARWVEPAWPADYLVSDDVFRLIREMTARGERTPGRLVLVAGTFALGLLVVLGLTALQWPIYQKVFGLPQKTA